MLICIDYDGIYTEDPGLWQRFITDAIKSVYKVICAIMRYEEENIDPRLRDSVDIIYTNRKAKIKYLAELGIVPDIWIDDNPSWLFTNG